MKKRREVLFFLLFLPCLLLMLFIPGCWQEGAVTEEETELREEELLSRPEQVTAEEARQLLEEGNRRFTEGNYALKDTSGDRRNNLVKDGQKPFAIIVGCSDSRVPPEVVFDWALGDLFVIRTAGNIVDLIALGSIEYGVEHLHVPLIVVLGHDSCGAVKATLEAIETSARLTPNIGAVIEKIIVSVDVAGTGESTSLPGVEEVVDENIRTVSQELITQSKVIRDMVEQGDVTIVGAKYFMESGKVVFFDE